MIDLWWWCITYTGNRYNKWIDTNPNISYIAFDECHIIAETSILFRSQYCYDLPYLISELTNISSSIDSPKIMALTASLTVNDKNIVLQESYINENEVNE